MRNTECRVQGCTSPQKAKSLCHKHYYKALSEMAGPCSIKGCAKLISKKSLCESHYRKELYKNNPPCTVKGCNDPQVAKGICDKHRSRLRKNNSLDLIPREIKADYANHGLYGIWRWHAQRARVGLVDEWMDFNKFVKGVSPVPKNTTLLKLDINKRLGPGNYEWHKSITCKDKALYAKIYRTLHPRKVQHANLMKTHGITIDQYELMHKQQGGVCAICNQPETAIKPNGTIRHLAVDHCHDRNMIRGLLCTRCNLGLGGFKDNPEILKKAVDYLQKHGLE